MPLLPWSEALALGLDFMDDTHREFVELLACAEAASDNDLPALWQVLVNHTAEHFGREDARMQAAGFAADNCHSLQHRLVLRVLREAAARAAQGELATVRQMIRDLALWFPQHAQGMDAALALHLRGVGYDAATDQLLQPQALPATEIHGCGGACTTAAEPA